MTAFELVAKLTADTSGFDRAMNKADRSGRNLKDSLSGTFGKIKKVVVGALSVAAIKKGIDSVINLANEVSNAGDKIDKQSQALGLSRKAYQEWDYILGQNGASIDSLGVSMKTLNSLVLNAADGSKEAKNAFSKLGVNIHEIKKLSPEDQFEAVVRAFQKMPAGAKKSALAVQMFGRNGMELLPLLNQSETSIDELRQRAEELGIIMSDDAVDASVAYNDAMDDLNRTFTGLKNTFGAKLLPTFTSGVQKITNYAAKISTEYKKNGIKGVFETLVTDIKNIKWPTWDQVKSAIEDGWNTIVAGVKTLAKVVFGENVDGSIKWPTWEGEGGIQAKVTEAWNSIVENAKKLPEVIFGKDSSVSKALQNALLFVEDAGNWIIEHADIVALGIGSIIGAFELSKLAAINPLLAAIAVGAGLIITNWEKVKEIVDEVAKKIEEAKTKIEEVNKIFLSLQNGGEKKLAQGQVADLQMQMTKAAKTGQYDLFYKNVKQEMESAGFDAVEVEAALNAIKNASSPEWVSSFISQLGDANTAATALQELINGIAGDYDVNINVNTNYSDLPRVEVPTTGSSTKKAKTPSPTLPGHAKGGLVPYDNYPALLHRGEEILTASQARHRRDGSGLDMVALASGIISSIREGMDGASVNSYLDGKGVTASVNRRTVNQIKSRRFAR